MEEELKPCPICGGLSVGYYYEDDNEVSVLCHACLFETHYHRSEKSAARKWNAMPRRLRWTKEKPKENGFYWWRDGNKHLLGIICVCVEQDSMAFGSELGSLSKCTGEFAGPIALPEEP